MWGGGLRLRATQYSENSSVLSIGGYGIAIRDANGRIFSKGIDPGRLLARDNSKKFIYSTNYQGKIDEQYLPSLSPAHVLDVSNDGKSLTLNFNINDARVLSFALSLYDADRKYLGETQDLVNLYSEEPYVGLNKGSGLLTDGSPNRLVLSAGDVRFLAGKTLADVRQIEVVCFDGQRPEEVLPDRDVVLLVSRSAFAEVSGP